MLKKFLPIILLILNVSVYAQNIVPMFGGNAQHTAVYSPAALNNSRLTATKVFQKG